MKKRVWFNKGLSSLYNVFDLIRTGDLSKIFSTVCSHTNPEFIGFATADESMSEPIIKLDHDYLDWCLHFSKINRIDYFVPARRASFLINYADAFKRIGTTIHQVCPPDMLPIIEHKSEFYRYCSRYDLPIPSYFTVNNLQEFDEAYSDLKKHHKQVCFKPSVSVFGLGFRLICETGNEIVRLMNGETYQIGLDHARAILSEQNTFRDLMVMTYLEGKERSVDCLADKGKLLRYVIREKTGSAGGAQHIEDNALIGSIVKRLTALFSMNGLYNIQFRDSNGMPYLLEINPRMSGGLHFTALTGLNLPYWSLANALKICSVDDIPLPQTGIKVGKADIGVLLK